MDSTSPKYPSKRFSTFPKVQDYYLVYSADSDFDSRLFRALRTQLSARESFALRLLASRVARKIRSLFRHAIDVPLESSEFIGIIKEDRRIFFQMVNGEPLAVWRSSTNSIWQRSPFLGYQIIEEYSLEEFRKKRKPLENALHIHWSRIRSGQNLHGDLTHFNILLDSDSGPVYIDQKNCSNSEVFDFFYFYSYLRQGVDKNTTLTYDHRKEVVGIIDEIVGNVCRYPSYDSLDDALRRMDISDSAGLVEPQRYGGRFFEILRASVSGSVDN